MKKTKQEARFPGMKSVKARQVKRKKKHKKQLLANWEYVKPLYESGKTSLQAICDQYNEDHKTNQTYKQSITEAAIRARAIKEDWARDLTPAINKKITTRMLRKNVRATAGLEEVVEKAVDSGVKILTRQQKMISKIAGIEGKLYTELVKSCMKGSKITLKDKSMIIERLVNTTAKRIALERQAHNIDSGSQKGITPVIQKELHERIAVIVQPSGQSNDNNINLELAKRVKSDQNTGIISYES